ncbi:hypothetical protein Tco_0031965 [Tanacetum coccineum]
MTQRVLWSTASGVPRNWQLSMLVQSRQYYGLTLNCLPGKLSEKIIESQETKTKFHNLYESMNNLSTTDALKLYNDDLSKTRVREGKQNSDGSVLDSYHQQLRSLVLESPAIVLSTGKDPSLE